ncbi:hypothetical protein ACFL54_03820 [Planctomycetota bacterium]
MKNSYQMEHIQKPHDGSPPYWVIKEYSPEKEILNTYGPFYTKQVAANELVMLNRKRQSQTDIVR